MKHGWHVSLFLVALIISPAGCGGKGDTLAGSWSSVSIENPDPLFRSTLPDRTPGRVKAVFHADGSFTWNDPRDKKEIWGTYRMSGGAVVLAPFRDRPLKAVCRLSRDRLVLTTDDGFVFTFVRTREK